MSNTYINAFRPVGHEKNIWFFVISLYKKPIGFVCFKLRKILYVDTDVGELFIV